MKDIIIFGAGYKGRVLNRMIKSEEIGNSFKNYNVKYFCDNYKVSGSYVDGVKVIHPSTLDAYCNNGTRIFISTLRIADEVARQLLEIGIQMDTYIVPDYLYQFKWNAKNNMPAFIKIDLTKPRMPYLECRIVMHCNLNCKGCTGFSNIHEPEVMTLESFEKYLVRLKELYWGIKYLKLFGGEPLLHPQLSEFIELARKYFPDSKLVVHSNGLLIPSTNEEVFKTMNKMDAKFVFTLYIPTGLKKRIIEDILCKEDIEYVFREPVYEFRKVINSKGDYDPNEIYKTCSKCINLIDGILSCGLGYIIDALEKHFNVKICEDKFQRCIDIHSTELDGWEINKILSSSSNLCGYCALMDFRHLKDDNFYEWKCEGKPQLSDWLL